MQISPGNSRLPLFYILETPLGFFELTNFLVVAIARVLRSCTTRDSGQAWFEPLVCGLFGLPASPRFFQPGRRSTPVRSLSSPNLGFLQVQVEKEFFFFSHGPRTAPDLDSLAPPLSHAPTPGSMPIVLRRRKGNSCFRKRPRRLQRSPLRHMATAPRSTWPRLRHSINCLFFPCWPRESEVRLFSSWSILATRRWPDAGD